MITKATFKNSIKDLLNFNSFILGVSMGSKNHTGKAFEATVDCINRSGLKQGIIDVSDTLRRFTHMAGISEKEARKRALGEGLQWLIDNTEAIKKFRVPVVVKHWDTWLNDPRFTDYLAQFQSAYKESPALRAAITKDIDNFYHRRFNKAADIPNDHDLSIRFYMEELAVMSIQFEDTKAAQLYAGKELNCLKLIRSGEVADIPTGTQDSKFYRINVYDAPANEHKQRPDPDKDELLYG